MHINNLTLAGRLTRDPDLKFTTSGKGILEFSLAYNEKIKGVEYAHFFDCVCFQEKTAQIISENARKGDELLIEGKISQDRWEDKSTGQKRSKVKIVCWKIHLLNGFLKQPETPTEPGPSDPDDVLKDLPF